MSVTCEVCRKNIRKEIDDYRVVESEAMTEIGKLETSLEHEHSVLKETQATILELNGQLK